MMRTPHRRQGAKDSRSDFSPQTWHSFKPALLRHSGGLQRRIGRRVLYRQAYRRAQTVEHDPCLALTSNLPVLAPYGHCPCCECRSRTHPARAKSLQSCGLLPRNWDYCTVKEFPACPHHSAKPIPYLLRTHWGWRLPRHGRTNLLLSGGDDWESWVKRVRARMHVPRGNHWHLCARSQTCTAVSGVCSKVADLRLLPVPHSAFPEAQRDRNTVHLRV